MARVLVVDDQTAFRRAARELLEHAGFQVVGEARSATDAVLTERALRPHVVLLDVRLPDGSGLDVARTMRDHEMPPIVVLTSTADYARHVRECDAQGFVLKADLSAETFRAVLSETA